MAKRILNWSASNPANNKDKVLLPSYYMDGEYVPMELRIHSTDAPVVNVSIDIYDDGVSIMNDNAYTYESYIADTQGYVAVTTFKLDSGQTSDEMAKDFNNNIIEPGSWLTCKVDGDVKNITVQLELESLTEENEDE